VEEIEAVLDLNCVDIVLLAPALPKSERITIGGYHLVDQLPIVRFQLYSQIRVSIGWAKFPLRLLKKARKV